MKKQLITALAYTALIPPLQADTIGFEIGAHAWNSELSGDVASGRGNAKIDTENDLGFGDEVNNSFYLHLEHPFPIIPNIRLQHTELELSGNKANSAFDFGSTTFNGSVSTDIDLTSNDITLYYEILDNWISLDVGFTVRIIDDGSITVTGVSNGNMITESFDADGVLPLLYGAAKIELPLAGLYFGADINGLVIGDDKLFDSKVNLGWESGMGLGVEAGYRRYTLDYDDDNDIADLTIEGIYAGVFYHF